MKPQCLFIGLFVGLALASCSSMRRLSDRDSPVASTMTRKPRNTERKFLEQIEVTPGGMVASTYTKPVSQGKAVKSESPRITVSEVAATNFNLVKIENANMLQLKYAVAMDVTVEKLTNLPLLQTIDKWWGTRYCLGGSTEECLDCSAFTQIVMRDVYHQNMPRTAEEQFNTAQKIELEELREGDLVFFNTGDKEISHVGVYLVNNKFVHATTSGGVMISDLTETYWQQKYRGAGRFGK